MMILGKQKTKTIRDISWKDITSDDLLNEYIQDLYDDSFRKQGAFFKRHTNSRLSLALLLCYLEQHDHKN